MEQDPYLWTCGEVLEFFRKAAQDLLHDRPHAQLALSEDFLSSLATNDVTGVTLLEDVDNSSLRDDFGIAKLGTRGTVLHCIKKLRLRSPMYCSHHGSVTATPAATPATTARPTEMLDAQVAVPTIETPSVRPDERDTTDGISSLERKPPQTMEPTAQRTTESIDPQGRRRMTLMPTQTTSAYTISRANGKGAVPLPDTARGYLGDGAFTVDMLFFGDTKFGSPLPDWQPSAYPLGSLNVNVVDDDNFQFVNPVPGMSKGQVAFAESQLRHFMAGPEMVKLERDDRRTLAIHPYREALQLKARSTLLFQFPAGGAEPIATREVAAHVISGQSYTDDNAQSVSESMAADMEIINMKFGDSDELLPLWQESERGRSMSLSSRGSEDSEADEVENGSLSADQASHVIDETIQEYINDWHSKLPALEAKKGWSVWKKMKQRQSLRHTLIQGAQSYVDMLSRRISKMKEGFLRSEWQSEDVLHKACENMHFSVDEREEQKWMITIWQRKKEPAHTVRHGGRVNRSTRATDPRDHHRSRYADDSILDDRISLSPARSVRDVNDLPAETVEQESDDTYNPEDFVPNMTEDDDHDMADAEPDTPWDILDDTNGVAEKSPEAREDGHVTGEAAMEDNDHMPQGVQTVAENGDSADQQSATNTTNSDEPPTQHRRQRPNQEHQSRVIDLTLSSDSAEPQSSPTPASTKTKKKALGRSLLNRDADPFTADATEVAEWDMNTLAEQNDRQRLLVKLLSVLSSDLRESMHASYRSLGQAAFRSQLIDSCRKFQIGPTKPLRDPMIHCARIYVAWLIATPEILGWAMESRLDYPPSQLTANQWTAVFDVNQAQLFAGMLNSVLAKNHSKMFASPKKRKASVPSSEIVIVSDEDEDGEPSKSTLASDKKLTPHKKRKRTVQASALADQKRKRALEREQKYQVAMEEREVGWGDDLSKDGDRDTSAIVINPVRGSDDEAILILDTISEKLKPHQIEGIRFLWREITASDHEEATHGCILAHTMGLGKSMQVLALLSAVDKASQSSNARVVQQLPKALRPSPSRRLRFLILCPPSLIQNWRREIDCWLPGNRFGVFSLEAGQSVLSQDIIEKWLKSGGFMFIGYQMFRDIVKESSSEAKETRDLIGQRLLDQTDIVVADEAHNLKNQDSKTTKAASRLITGFRIALSGTPLSNNTLEIYSLVSWVSPGYLGDPIEFRARFEEPIREGLYEDSSYDERRRSIKRLKVLHHNIGPKVNRATIEALRGSLKPKIEFVITVPLSRVQAEVYTRFIKAILGDSKYEKARTTQIFGWMSLLTLLTNHPSCFRRKLLEPPKENGPKKKSVPSEATLPSDVEHRMLPGHSAEVAEQTTHADSEDVQQAAGDEDVYTLGLTPAMVSAILGDTTDDMDLDIKLSSKAAIFARLLAYCLQCKDKVLVFSTSIPTLQYLDKLLKSLSVRFGRIDGSVPIAKRPQILEDFHQGLFDVILISTRAGGLGLNIQGANRVFIFDFSFNPSWEEQAIGRAYRIGQPKPVYVYRFVAGGTFEHNLYNTQIFKSSLAQRVVDKKNPKRSAERSTREWLYEPRKVSQKNISDWAGKDEKVLDRLIELHVPGEEGKMDTMIREICTMETLQQEALDAPLDPEEEKEVNLEIEEGRGRRTKKGAQAPTSMRPGLGVGMQAIPSSSRTAGAM